MSVVIPEGVTFLNCFGGCTSLTSIALPSTLTTIGQATFRDCTNITEVTVPAAVNHIVNFAFDNSGITSVIFENPNNWYVYVSSIGGPSDLSDPNLEAVDVSDPAVNATNFNYTSSNMYNYDMYRMTE